MIKINISKKSFFCLKLILKTDMNKPFISHHQYIKLWLEIVDVSLNGSMFKGSLLSIPLKVLSFNDIKSLLNMINKISYQTEKLEI